MNVAAALVVALLVALVVQEYLHRVERDRWAAERKMLVDRAIARHSGEVLAFDRQTQPKAERPERVEIYPEGLS